MAYFHRHTSPFSSSASSRLSSASSSTVTTTSTSCGTHCPCRTVSSVSSTTPTIARVQLNPYLPSTTINLPAAMSGNSNPEDLFEPLSSPDDDPSRQDFDFGDVFSYDDDHHTTTRAYDGDAGDMHMLHEQEKSQSDFSFSHYSHQAKSAGYVRTRSGLLKVRHVRVKSGGNRAG